jgi:hypothetical protein
MEQNNYRDFYTQFTEDWPSSPQPKSIMINGILQNLDYKKLNKNHIAVYQVVPSEQSDAFYTALNTNLNNPNISSITLLCNRTVLSRAIDDKKIKIVSLNLWDGIKFNHIFQLFTERTINVVFFDSIVLDYTTADMIFNVPEKTIGLLSSKTFVDGIPENFVNYNFLSKHNPNNFSEFNALIINNTKNIELDYYFNFYGSINLVINKFYCNMFNVVNLSRIVTSFLLENNVDYQKCQHYVDSDLFAIIFAVPQLDYSSASGLEIKLDLDRIKQFIDEPKTIFNYRNITFDTLQRVPSSIDIIDKSDISQLQHIILHNFYKEYNHTFNNTFGRITEEIELYKTETLNNLQKELDEFKDKRLKDIEEIVNNDFVQKHRKLDEELNEKSTNSLLLSKRNELQYKQEYETKYERLYNEKLLNLDSELKARETSLFNNTNDVIKQYFDENIKKRNTDIDIYSANRKREIEDELENYNKSALTTLQKNHEAEKRRLEISLLEFRRYCETKIEAEAIVQNKERFEKEYLTAREKMHSELLQERSKKVEELRIEYDILKKNHNSDLQNAIIIRNQQTEKAIETYKAEQMKYVREEIDVFATRHRELELLKAKQEVNAYSNSEYDRVNNEIRNLELSKQIKLNEEMQEMFNSNKYRIDNEIKMYEESEVRRSRSSLREKESSLISEAVNMREVVILEQLQTFHATKDLELQELYKKNHRELESRIELGKKKINVELKMHHDVELEKVTSRIKQKSEDLEHKLIEYHANRMAAIDKECSIVKEMYGKDLEITKQTTLADNLNRINHELEDMNLAARERYMSEFNSKKEEDINKYKLELQTELDTLLSEQKHKIEIIQLQHQTRLEADKQNVFNEMRKYKETMLKNQTFDNEILESQRIEHHNRQIRNTETEVKELRERSIACLKDEVEHIKKDMILATKTEIRENMIDEEKRQREELDKFLSEEKSKILEENMKTLEGYKQEHLQDIERLHASKKDIELAHQAEIDNMITEKNATLEQIKEDLKFKAFTLNAQLLEEIASKKKFVEEELEKEMDIKREKAEREMRTRIMKVEKELSTFFQQ